MLEKSNLYHQKWYFDRLFICLVWNLSTSVWTVFTYLASLGSLTIISFIFFSILVPQPYLFCFNLKDVSVCLNMLLSLLQDELACRSCLLLAYCLGNVKVMLMQYKTSRADPDQFLVKKNDLPFSLKPHELLKVKKSLDEDVVLHYLAVSIFLRVRISKVFTLRSTISLLYVCIHSHRKLIRLVCIW